MLAKHLSASIKARKCHRHGCFWMSFRIDGDILEADSLESVFSDLEIEALFRNKAAEMKTRLEESRSSHSTASLTPDSNLRTKTVRLLSSMSDEVRLPLCVQRNSKLQRCSTYPFCTETFLKNVVHCAPLNFFMQQFVFFNNLFHFGSKGL